MESTLHAAALKKIDKAYDSPPWWYDIRGFFILKLSYRSTLLSQVRFFGKNISSNHLEVAIGTGTLLDLTLRWRAWKKLPDAKVTGFDYAESMLEGARNRFSRRAGVNLLRADATRLEFPDNSFDSANIANALHCFPKVDAALSEMQRVLKPGARLAMNVILFPKDTGMMNRIAMRICEWGMRKGILETPYEREDIEGRIKAAGFEILESALSGNSLMLMARKPLEPVSSSAPLSAEPKAAPVEYSYEVAVSRNIGWLTEAEQRKLRGKRVAIGGLGGTGGVHLQTLARLGIGAFHIADFDTYCLANFNRQAGATVTTLNRKKVDVMEQAARDINPQVELRTFPDGISEQNVEEFLRGTDLYVDAIDYFAFETRELIYRKCAELGIPAVTAAPLGMGAACITFLPGQMTFEQYFCLTGLSKQEKAVRFLAGLSPALLQCEYLVDAGRVRLGEGAGPSTGMACQLCAGVAGTEALKILLQRGKVLAAPHAMQFDAYRNKAVRTWRPFGNRHPLQRLVTALIRRRLRMA